MIDILIPVLNRPHRAAPLVENIHENTVGEHRILFLCSPSDLEERVAVALTKAPVAVVPWEPGPGDYAKKINAGFHMTGFWHDEDNRLMNPGHPGWEAGEWVFLGADDLCFCPGWDVHALATAEATGAHVIGTDDLGNPTVQRGDHATHLLVRRSYVSEQGSSWDGPGIVYHEGYDHQFVDAELVAVAKQRGVWAFSHGSKVEHLHTLWGKADRDATYDKALAKSSEDNRRWAQRRREFS